MLTSHRLQIERGELQNKINSDRYIEIRPADGDSGTRIQERKEMTAKLASLNNEIAKAVEEEDEDSAKPMTENKGLPFGQTAETRELRQLAGKGSVDRILRAAVRGWGISDGPEHELQSHFDLDSNVLPSVTAPAPSPMCALKTWPQASEFTR